jgi:predicted XRE-type DNA-binding protein
MRHQDDDMSDERDITHGTTNVFADLGLPDAIERQTKTKLAKEVNDLVKSRKLKQVEAGKVLGIPQSKVSALANYRLDGLSVEKLIEFLTALNQDVEIMIRPSREATGTGQVSVHAVR